MTSSSSRVCLEVIASDRRLRCPYRGIVPGAPTLRITVTIQMRGMPPSQVRIDVDDTSVEVCDPRGRFVIGAIDQLFIVERQPPAWCFLTWFGVFARRHGTPDRLLLETPDGSVARYVERTIEERLGLRDEPVRGELRLAE